MVLGDTLVEKFKDKVFEHVITRIDRTNDSIYDLHVEYAGGVDGCHQLAHVQHPAPEGGGVMAESIRAREMRARRAVERAGYRLVKIADRWFITQTVASLIDLDAVETWLSEVNP